jgi:RNA polymerase sigma-70 factor, ECF subfamily
MTPLGSPEIQSYVRDAAEAQFAHLYSEHGRCVLAYALPRTAGPEDAADVVAETFLVAWRRVHEVPTGTDARLWLLGVARRVLANQRRGESRRTRLAERLRVELRAAVPAQPGPDGGGSAAAGALARLGSDDRELLLLSAWEGLTPAQIATVLEISAVAARTRLHRARRRLRAELAAENAAPAVTCNEELRFEEGR